MDAEAEDRKDELRNLKIMEFLTESQYHDLNERWGQVFRAAMGAEAFYDICKQVNLESLSNELRATMRTTRS